MTTDTEQKNFLGIPIHGDIYATAAAKKQRADAELQDAIRDLLEYESFTSLRWRQYTPYFNDGDPCVFSAYGVGIEIPVSDEEDRDSIGDYEDGYEDLPRTYVSEYAGDKANALLNEFVGVRNYQRVYNRESGSYDVVKDDWQLEPKDPAMIEAAIKVGRMIDSGAYNNFLLRTFGDHAVVTLRKDRIDVDTYEHD